MKSPSHLPGQRWFDWIQSAAVRFGVLTGLYLGVILSLWLVLANRIPLTERFAGLRNLAAAALMGLTMLIPVGRFLRAPARLFASGITAWAVFTLAYGLLGFLFEHLHNRMSVFRFFMLGAAVYGVAAVFTLVASIVMAARHAPAQVRQRPL